MSPAGRPTLSGERKDERISIRVSSEEKAAIDAVAAAAGKPITTWLRDLALSAASQDAKPAARKKSKR